MNRSVLVNSLCLVIFGALTLAAQSSNKKAAAGSDLQTPWIQKNYKAPNLAWGHPDLQGVWANAASVPLQRPADLGTKTHYTPAELAAKRAKEDATPPPTPGAGTTGDVHYDLDQFGLSRGETVEDLRTSLITSPANGRIPAQTAAGRKRNADRAAERQGKLFDSTEFRGLAERCILWGAEGPPITPIGYNPNLQIVQTKDYVAITQEMIHDTRIIPLDGRPHLDPSIRQWFGDSRGHFEGDTLVIDTTNFTEKTNWQGSGAKLHVVERIRRTSPSDIEYSFTVEDPDTWDQPWSATIPWPKADADTLFEYACHEGNYGMPNILSGQRAAEAAAAKK
jgi:hypothetical protein